MGIPTVAIGQSRGYMNRIRYPRALVTRHPRGQTVGAPGDQAGQRQVLLAALTHLGAATVPGVSAEYSVAR